MVWYGAYELCLMLILLFGLCVLTSGWGRLVAGASGLPTDKVLYPDNLWLGLICITLALSFAHFFILISWPMRCGVILVGLIGLSRTKDLSKQTALVFKQIRSHPLVLVCFSVGLTMLCQGASSPSYTLTLSFWHPNQGLGRDLHSNDQFKNASNALMHRA